MPRATIELDALLRHPSNPGPELRRIADDNEWARTLSAEPRTQTTPETVLADLHDLLLTVQYPAAADLAEIEDRLATARAAARDWAGRALAGQAQITLDADACYMLFQLIGRVDRVAATAILQARFGPWRRRNADTTEPDFEPAPVRVAV